MFHRKAATWSPVETEYLRANRTSMPVNQLTISLAKSRAAIKRKCDELDGKPVPKRNGRNTKIGKRSDLGVFVRSGWEANVLRWLNQKKPIKKWEYEPEVFPFFEFGHRSGTTSYCPDIKYGNLWIEVKGNLEPKGKTAIRRFKKYYPKEFKKLRAIVGRPGTKADLFFKEIGVPIMAYMNELDKKHKKTLEHWE